MLSPATGASLPAYTLSPLPPNAIELSFQTLSLAQRGWGSKSFPDRPTIGVIASTSDVDQWQTQLASTILASLKSVDYSRNIAILVNRGESQCLPPEPSEVLQVVRQDHRIRVFANFPEYPSFGWSRPCSAILVYPHHIVVVPKQGVWQDTFTFELMVGPRSVATVDHWIPYVEAVINLTPSSPCAKLTVRGPCQPLARVLSCPPRHGLTWRAIAGDGETRP